MQDTTSKRGRVAGRKRTRVPLACEPCRERKVRCDGVKPTCGECLKRKLPRSLCNYSTIDSFGRNSSQRDYIKSLHDRIDTLEKAQDQREIQTPENSESQADIQEHVTTSQVLPRNQTPKTPIPVYAVPMLSQNDPHKSSSDEESNVNAMGAIFSMPKYPKTQRDSLYGESSIVSLASQIGQDQDQEGTSVQAQSFVPRPQKPDSSLSNARRRISHFLLPSRSDADHLLDQFWRNFHLFYPWIHFPSFLKAYELLWTKESSGTDLAETSRVGLGSRACSQEVFHCALNVIFALGCEFTNSTQQDGENPGSEFMDRANKLFSIGLLDKEGLSVVQTLLLLSIYLQSTQNPQQCWGVAGLSLRMAQGIGLHLEPTFTSRNTLEIEMRRRVWHGCLLMDRIVSMSLGRLPTPLGNVEVPMFSAVDDEYLRPTSEPCQQPASTFSRVAFAVSQCKLGEILGQIQEGLYGQRRDEQSQNNSTTAGSYNRTSTDSILTLEDSLNTFEHDLPLPLSSHSEASFDSQSTSSSIRQGLSLQTKLLHARIMLYRSFLARTPRLNSGLQRAEAVQGPGQPNRGRESIRSVFALECATKCFRAAGDLIEVLHLVTLGQFYGAWWYGLFYLMTACTVLIMSESTPHLADELDEKRLAQLWASAAEIFDVLKVKHPMVAQCADALQVLRARAATSQGPSPIADATSMQAFPAGMFGQNDSSAPPQASEIAGKGADNISWMTVDQSMNSANLDDDSDPGLRNFYSGYWPMLQGLQGSFTEAAGSGMVWGGSDQSWYWTPF